MKPSRKVSFNEEDPDEEKVDDPRKWKLLKEKSLIVSALAQIKKYPINQSTTNIPSTFKNLTLQGARSSTRKSLSDIKFEI